MVRFSKLVKINKDFKLVQRFVVDALIKSQLLSENPDPAAEIIQYNLNCGKFILSVNADKPERGGVEVVVSAVAKDAPLEVQYQMSTTVSFFVDSLENKAK